MRTVNSAKAPGSAALAANAPEQILIREDISGVVVLTLNRPAARNSLSEAMLKALSDALSAVAQDRNVRAVVVTANGPAFSAGHDLKELSEMTNNNHYDVIIIGTGAGGGTLAHKLAPDTLKAHGDTTE